MSGKSRRRQIRKFKSRDESFRWAARWHGRYIRFDERVVLLWAAERYGWAYLKILPGPAPRWGKEMKFSWNLQQNFKPEIVPDTEVMMAKLKGDLDIGKTPRLSPKLAKLVAFYQDQARLL